MGDLGGGALFLLVGILAALWERERSGLGQVIDAAIVDCVTSMMGMFSGLPVDHFSWLQRDRSLLGGAAPFYRCYRCSDELEIAVGALEPKFYQVLVEGVGAPAELRDRQYETAAWPARRKILANLFSLRARREWCDLLEGLEACFAPVLTVAEAPYHPHLTERGSFVPIRGMDQPAPVPRLSRTPGAVGRGGVGLEALKRWALCELDLGDEER